MFFSYSSDYIKYLNDPEGHVLNYDQWKDRKIREEKRKNSGKGKIHLLSKYNY